MPSQPKLRSYLIFGGIRGRVRGSGCDSLEGESGFEGDKVLAEILANAAICRASLVQILGLILTRIGLRVFHVECDVEMEWVEGKSVEVFE